MGATFKDSTVFTIVTVLVIVTVIMIVTLKVSTVFMIVTDPLRGVRFQEVLFVSTLLSDEASNASHSTLSRGCKKEQAMLEKSSNGIFVKMKGGKRTTNY